jgi:hypothetical protein
MHQLSRQDYYSIEGVPSSSFYNTKGFNYEEAKGKFNITSLLPSPRIAVLHLGQT